MRAYYQPFSATFVLSCTILVQLISPLSACAGSQPPPTAHAQGPVESDDEALAALDVDAPGMSGVKSAMQAKDLAQVKRAYLDYRRTKCPAKYTVMPSDKPTVAVEKTDVLGDEVTRHFIRNTYGFNPMSGDMGQPFDWKGNPVPRSDPNFTVQWTSCVISRTGFWKDLADAYWKTLNEQYAQTWVDQFLDFVAKNPSDARPTNGDPSLWVTLDASGRMFNSWPYCYFHFIDSPAFTPDVQWTYLRSILDHVKVLKGVLQLPHQTGNWVAAECYGLYTIGVLFPELREAASWRAFAFDRMAKELNTCIPPDGFEAELTPNYHYFTLSSYTGPVQLARLNHLEVPPSFHDKMLAMYRAPIWVMDQRGFDVATNDSGALNAARQARDGLRLLGSDPLLEWAASGAARGEQPPNSTMLPYAGFYAMRGGWNPNDMFLFFRAGPTGIGHQHEDMLEVVLRAWNKSLLFEQGTYSYDQSDWRRFVLGTSSHSTVIVDGNGQHRGPSSVPVTQPVANPWFSTPLFDFVAGTYDKGYQKSVHDLVQYMPVKYVGPVDRSVTHTRRVLFLKPYYALVLDTLDGTGTHTFDSLYYLDSPGAVIDSQTQAAVSQNSGDVQLALYPLDRSGLTTEIIKGQMDPILGWFASEHRAVPTIRFRKNEEAPARFATFLYPYFGERPAFHAVPLPVGDGAWGESIHTPLEDTSVAISLDDSTRSLVVDRGPSGNVRADAAGVIARQHPNGDALIGAWGLTHFADRAYEFSAASPATLVWQKSHEGLVIFNANEEARALTVISPFKFTATLPANHWTLVFAGGQKEASSPDLFQPIVRIWPEQAYADYLKSVPHAPAGMNKASILISPDQFVLPAHMQLRSKVGVDHPVVAAWEETDSRVTASVSLQQGGWYHIKLRYCTGDRPMRSILINGKYPFSQAHSFSFPSTVGDAQSDGWSSRTNDWKEIAIGEPQLPGGWLFYLPTGNATISLENNGGGLNIDSLELEPAITP